MPSDAYANKAFGRLWQILGETIASDDDRLPENLIVNQLAEQFWSGLKELQDAEESCEELLLF